MTRFHPRFLPVPVALAALLAAAPAAPDDPDELIRRANAAFLQGDAPAADALYAAAGERTGDPGLVAFNRAAVLFQRGDFYAAEVQYARALDDRACPPGRAARAWFSRGTCLLRRGGDAAVYRSAVACFDHALDAPAADDTLKADARYNLELAKQLWAEANRTAAKPDSPSLPPPEQEWPEAPPVPPPGFDPSTPDPDAVAQAGPTDPRQPPKGTPGAIAQAGPGDDAGTPVAGNTPRLQPLKDEDETQPLSPEDTRRYLQQTDARLRTEWRHLRRLLYAPDRPGVRDW